MVHVFHEIALKRGIELPWLDAAFRTQLLESAAKAGIDMIAVDITTGNAYVLRGDGSGKIYVASMIYAFGAQMQTAAPVSWFFDESNYQNFRVYAVPRLMNNFTSYIKHGDPDDDLVDLCEPMDRLCKSYFSVEECDSIHALFSVHSTMVVPGNTWWNEPGYTAEEHDKPRMRLGPDDIEAVDPKVLEKHRSKLPAELSKTLPPHQIFAQNSDTIQVYLDLVFDRIKADRKQAIRERSGGNWWEKPAPRADETFIGQALSQPVPVPSTAAVSVPLIRFSPCPLTSTYAAEAPVPTPATLPMAPQPESL